jgi:hypothetical protein
MEFNGTTAAALLGIYATLAMDAYSAFCSSPQTTEINIDRREESLMYWVKLGSVFGIAAGILASVISKNITPMIATGAMVLLFWFLYGHAAKRGKERADYAGTED